MSVFVTDCVNQMDELYSGRAKDQRSISVMSNFDSRIPV